MSTEARLSNIESKIETMQRSLQDLEVQVDEVQNNSPGHALDLLMLSNQILSMSMQCMETMAKALAEKGKGDGAGVPYSIEMIGNILNNGRITHAQQVSEITKVVRDYYGRPAK